MVVGAPDEVGAGAEAGVLELGVGVDDVVSVAKGSEVAAGGCESEILRKCLTLTEFFDILRVDYLSLLRLFICSLEQPQVEVLHLVRPDPHYLSVAVSSQWILVSNLDYHCTFIKPKRHHV